MSQNAELLSGLPACPVETTLTLIGNKWEVLILRDLMESTKRFGELRRSVGHISQKVLTSQLRTMEEAGLVHREVFAEVPPRVEYSLTPLGRSLQPVLDSLRDWGTKYKRHLSDGTPIME
ncbi:winged helix-turn-helix transcriptional regulator [Tractidigestivibacter sp.]|jgi:DNA-binding HxlR family transcriptional regulator|uniref:winged helix-turn-helix transcriptional regulator n=1 Tax=Tractidigestivibacter sp. TaxID=2847320 RepID=UPI003FD87A5B